jgi:hypothetical protein
MHSLRLGFDLCLTIAKLSLNKWMPSCILIFCPSKMNSLLIFQLDWHSTIKTSFNHEIKALFLAFSSILINWSLVFHSRFAKFTWKEEMNKMLHCTHFTEDTILRLQEEEPLQIHEQVGYLLGAIYLARSLCPWSNFTKYQCMWLFFVEGMSGFSWYISWAWYLSNYYLF